jgi:hypothetical protein
VREMLFFDVREKTRVPDLGEGGLVVFSLCENEGRKLCFAERRKGVK